MKYLIILLGLVAQAASGQTVYRCPSGGRIIYQDRPCTGAAAGENRYEIKAVPSEPAPSAPVQAVTTPPAGIEPINVPPVPNGVARESEPLPRPNEAALREARIGNRVLIGMTQSDVLASAGKYRDHEVQSGADANGTYEIWTFRQRYETFPLTIAFRDGIVVQFSSRDLPYLSY